jgi:hypothetical protein
MQYFYLTPAMDNDDTAIVVRVDLCFKSGRARSRRPVSP